MTVLQSTVHNTYHLWSLAGVGGKRIEPLYVCGALPSHAFCVESIQGICTYDSI